MVMELQHRVFTGNHAIEAPAVGTIVDIGETAPLSHIVCNGEEVDMVLDKAYVPPECRHFDGFIGALVIDTGRRSGFETRFIVKCGDILVADRGRLKMFGDLEKLEKEYDIM